jgi:hypothetical protein
MVGTFTPSTRSTVCRSGFLDLVVLKAMLRAYEKRVNHDRLRESGISEDDHSV